MTIKSRVLILLLLFLLSGHLSVAFGNSDDLEWKVSVGDKMKYVFTKVYSYNISDATSTDVLYMRVEAMNGTMVDLAYTAGTKFFIEITQLEGRFATSQITMEGVTYKLEYTNYISQTTDNLTYWENKVGTEDLGLLKANTSLDGDEYKMEELCIVPQYNQTQEAIYKKNWKTGWHTYTYVIQYQNVSGDLVVIRELELMVDTSKDIPGFTILSVFFCLPIVLIIIRYSNRKKLL